MANNATPITSLTSGTPKLTDVYPAVDVTDTSQAPTGTTKKYIISALANLMVNQLGFTSYPSSRVATTSNLNATYNNGPFNDGINATLTNAGAQAALVIDGISLVNTNIVIVKDQVAPEQNGIYVVQVQGTSSTNWVLIRASYFNSAANITDNGAVESLEGTVNAQKFWQVDFTGTMVVGTTPISFVPFAFGDAAFKEVTDNTAPLVVSMEGVAVVNNLPKFADVNGSIIDSGIGVGTAAAKTASDNGATYVASVTNAGVAIGNVAAYSDTVGTLTDGGVLGNATHKDVTDNAQPLVASVDGATVVGHLAVFSDTVGTIADGGSVGVGTAATKDASDNTQANVASVPNIGVTIGHIAKFSDVVGSITDTPGAAVNLGTLQAGSNGIPGSLISFAPTAGNGSIIISAIDAGGAFNTTVKNSVMGQSTDYQIPDPGAAGAKFVVNPTPLVNGNLVVGTAVDGVIEDSGLSLKKVVSAAIAGGSATSNIVDAFVSATSVVNGHFVTQTNPAVIQLIVEGAGSFNVITDVDPGASTFSYTVMN